MAFINSKVRLAVRLEDGSFYTIPKDFIGEIPDQVAASWLVQAAIKSGQIAVPEARTDKALEEADEKAEAKKKRK